MQRAHHERGQIAGICSDDGDTNEHKERQRGSENEIHLGLRVRNKGCLEEGEVTHFVADGGSGKSAMADGKVVRRQQAKS